jgi:hypothetical protein
MKIKYVVVRCVEDLCEVDVYFQPVDGGDAIHSGLLKMKPNEWLLFATAQLLARDLMKGHYKVEFDEEKYTAYINSRES